MAGSESKSGNRAPWIAFDDDAARLRRVIFPSGNKGLLLQFSDRKAGGEIRKRALEYGFEALKTSLSVVLPANRESGKVVRPNELAAALGGRVIEADREKLEAYPEMLDYRQPDLGRGGDASDAGNIPELQEIGRNHLGEPVFRAPSGGRKRLRRDADGRETYEDETQGSKHAEFLRASDPEDYPAIAAGLVRMADRGPVGRDIIRSVAHAACEPRAHGDPALEAGPVEEALRGELLKQIVSMVMEEGDARECFRRALRCADAAADALELPGGGESGFPSPKLLIFLRRQTRDADQIDFSGGERFAIAAPTLASKGVITRQLLDFTDTAADGVAERVLNSLARREADGSSILLVAGSPSDAGPIRQIVGKAYALELVAAMPPLIATGRPDGMPVTIFFVGVRRPRMEESLPQAAQRTFEVDDLDDLHVELLRARKRIGELYEGLPAREDSAERQRRYVPLSSVSPPATMIAKSLEGATVRALQRVAEMLRPDGDIDRFVAGALGIDRANLGSLLTSEQVDAVALWHCARERSRGFLLADQTGVGKGRSMAAIARAHIRAGGRVLYLTENAEINCPDVWRDLVAVGAQWEAKPFLMVSRPVALHVPMAGEIMLGQEPMVYRTESAASRRQVCESLQWPRDRNLVLTNYSQFNRGEDHPSSRWVANAVDENVLLILDEAHNAINPGSNTGELFRMIIDTVGRRNVVFATATPLRNPSGADLYRALLPDTEGDRLDDILAGLAPGGETAQETFTTMLAEDGVMLRRDHNLENIEFHVRLPDDERLLRYQDIMNSFSPLVELMIDASIKIGSALGRAREARFQALLANGLGREAAVSQINSLFQYSGGTGSPLARLARLTMNAIKVDQTVEEAMNEIGQGRKPLITFHSTNAALLSEKAAEGALGDAVPLTLADQILRVADGIFRVRYDDEMRDMRESDAEIREMFHRIRDAVRMLPTDLSASPVDAVVEGLERQGIRAGEISGRALAYRGGRIVRRADTDRKATVDAFNDGRLDVLIYNVAGATGGSYHASPEFRDHKPRSLIEMEPPLDIIKYIQSQGRSNRYGQVARPRIVSVMTGLIPEMRILQQRNRKLRSLGASIDGNRSHPLLLDDVPDFLNKIGDQATVQVLQSNPDYARRLGFPEILERGDAEEASGALPVSTDSGASKSLVESIANRVLSRSLVLSANEQMRLVRLIQIEFEAIVEELDSRNANPLRPKEMPGEIEVRAQTLYSGSESAEESADISAFFAPLYMMTGIHHFTEDPITGDQLMQMVNQARISDGAEGFAPLADRVEIMLPTALAHLVRGGERIEDALANPSEQSYQFRARHQRLMRLVQLLRQIAPGRVLQIDGEDGARDNRLRTVVKLSDPDPENVHLPQAYRIRTVLPGDSQPQIMTLSRLVNMEPGRVRLLPGLETGVNERHLRTFSHQTNLERRYPVQILTGNLLAAIAEARRHALGTMSLFRDQTGRVHRGIVVGNAKVNLDYLPVVVPSARVAMALMALAVNNRLDSDLVMWVGERKSPLCRFAVYSYGNGVSDVEFVRPTKTAIRKLGLENGEFQSAIDQDARRRSWLGMPNEAVRLGRILSGLEGQEMLVDGRFRQIVNDIARKLEDGENPPDFRIETVAE